MKAMEWTFVDKTQWPDGEWNSEPDKLQWQDEATGLPCLIVRNVVGALCGYVGVDSGHPWYGVSYGYQEDCPDERVSVHGGLTYSDFCMEAENGICHVPAAGEPDRVWWLGFDCAHAGDMSPAYSYLLSLPRESYRNVAYVKAQCASLAAQIAAVQS